MTTNTEAPVWGAQQTPDPTETPTSRGKARKTGIAVAIALAIAAAGGGAIYATTGTDSTATTSQNQAGGQQPGGGQGGPGGDAQGGPFGTSTHGSFQQGEVTEISSSSVSVKSSDGYTQTYTIPSDVVSAAQDVQTGDTVTVVSEDGTTATSLMEANGQPPTN